MHPVVIRNLFAAGMILLLTPLVVASVIVAAQAGRPNLPAAAMGHTVSAILEANLGCLPFMAAGLMCLAAALYLNRSKSDE
jgi:hypothetical protein